MGNEIGTFIIRIDKAKSRVNLHFMHIVRSKIQNETYRFTIWTKPSDILLIFFLQILIQNTGLTQWAPIIYVWFVMHWLAMSHCCYNPIIYCYMNARFRIGFLQMLYFVPGLRRCCGINAYPRDRSTSLRTGIALTGKCEILYSFILKI